MNYINDSNINLFCENLQNEQTKVLGELKNNTNPDCEKLNHQEVVLITQIMSSLLKLRTVLKNKKEKV